MNLDYSRFQHHSAPNPALAWEGRPLVYSPRWAIWGAAAMLFILTASNGRPLWTSSGLWVMMLAPMLILRRGPGRLLRVAASRPNHAIFLALWLFLLANLLSTIATPSDEAILAFLQRCVLPMLVYLSMIGLVLKPTDVRLLILAVATGSGFLFLKGWLAYHAAWGIPDLSTILWGRYDIERMTGYSDATFGNLSQMGLYVVLVLPPLILAAIKWIRNRLVRSFLWFVSLIGLANLIVSGSRTGLALMFLSAGMIILSHGARKAVAFSVAIGGILIVASPIWLPLISDPEIIARYIPVLSDRSEDNSANERFLSVVDGWKIFLDNFAFGVGPGMSHHHSYWHIPHESIVHQLSELGLIGGVAFIWLNLVVLARTFMVMVAASRNPAAAFRLLWLIGPAIWLIFGIAGGIAFSSSWALAWVGIAHAMLALSTANVRMRGNGHQIAR